MLLVFFWRFVGPGLNGRFNVDDPMNIYYYWSRGPWQLVRNLFLFFTTYGRPMGGVYFFTLYHFFGLNPFPYHVVITALLLVNTLLTYRLARLVTGSQLAGWLAALFSCYHARLAVLVYLPAFIFDVLCTLFYLLALSYYVARRADGRSLGKSGTLIFLLLYICALDSKEMAISLPVMVLAYELIWYPPVSLHLRALRDWVRQRAIPALLGGALTVVYILGKTFGRETLIHMPAYRPEFTWARYWESTERFLYTIFYQPEPHNPIRLAVFVLLSIVLLGAAIRFRQKTLVWMSIFVWITPLPITFVPDRGFGCLYLPLIGWTIILACLCVLVFRTISAGSLGTAAARVLLVLLVAVFWRHTARQDRKVPEGIRNPGELTWNVQRQIQRIQPSVKPGSRIYVDNDPFTNYDLKFLFELTYHDRSVEVWLGRIHPLNPAKIASMDYRFTIEDGILKRLPLRSSLTAPQ